MRIRAGVLALFARRAAGLLVFLTALGGRRRRWRRRTGLTSAASAASTSACAAAPAAAGSADALVVGEPRRRLFRQTEAAGFLDRRDLTRRQRHDAEARAGGAVRLAAAARAPAGAFRPGVLVRPALILPGLALLVRLGLRDREDDELAVLRERRARAARAPELLAAAEVSRHELAVLALRRQRVGKPPAVARQARALDRSPGVHHVVRNRARGRTRLCRERPLNRERYADEQGGTACVGPIAHGILQIKFKSSKVLKFTARTSSAAP